MYLLHVCVLCTVFVLVKLNAHDALSQTKYKVEVNKSYKLVGITAENEGLGSCDMIERSTAAARP